MVSTARLVRLSKYLFSDFGTPDLDKLPQTPYPAVECHVCGRVFLENDKVRIELLSDNWVRKRIKDGKLPLAFELLPEPLVSANTAELRKFTVEQAEDHQAFSEIFTLLRKN
jgi:hypothetical protein